MGVEDRNYKGVHGAACRCWECNEGFPTKVRDRRWRAHIEEHFRKEYELGPAEPEPGFLRKLFGKGKKSKGKG